MTWKLPETNSYMQLRSSSKGTSPLLNIPPARVVVFTLVRKRSLVYSCNAYVPLGYELSKVSVC